MGFVAFGQTPYCGGGASKLVNIFLTLLGGLGEGWVGGGIKLWGNMIKNIYQSVFVLLSY